MNQIQTMDGAVTGAKPNDGTAVQPKQLKIYNAAIQKVDVQNQSLGVPFYRTSETDIKQYLSSLIEELLKNKRTQNFKIETDSEVGKLISGLTSTNFKDFATALTERLLTLEVKIQAQLAKFTTLRSGSLFCCHFKLDDRTCALIVKVDHADFLNENTFTKAAGLPAKDRAQKCAIFEVNDGTLEESVIIIDSSPSITEYWWQDYLTLTALSSPQVNTLRAFTAVEGLLATKVKPTSKSDYWTLRNALVGYFTTRPQCSYPDMVNELFGAYTPDSPNVSMQELIKAANQLPSRKIDGFDTHFDLTPSVINAKIKRQIKLSPNVDLRITGEVENIQNFFATGEENGRKFLKIYSVEGYNAFNREDGKDGEDGDDGNVS
ncbi:nucleoid-associated protein [Stutzerimonas nitrititolerans]|uniref:nucleoid-associated protein n=1 Tax=Stutzerimonas nitrititolerans TaxID=2482751 RepID=UPI0028B2675E|nr:nucleoid-associated protein [Stutzerimonas nitrititolerans]